MAAPGQQPGPVKMADSDNDDEDQVTDEFIPGMEKIKDERSELTEQQQVKHDHMIRALAKEYDLQKNVEANQKVLRLREQFLHVHGTLGSERAVDIIVVLKALQMAEQGLKVCILNLNFLKRLQTRATYSFLKDYVMMETAARQKLLDRIFLKIQEEDADEVDRALMMDELNDIAEDYPLFVITDESCKEAESIDDAVPGLMTNHWFHFWSCSSFAHGTPEAVARHRLALTRGPPPPIKQVMEMIDIDDDELSMYGRHIPPFRRVIYPRPEEGPSYNIREHLDTLKVFLISHNKHHLEQDVWECRQCGNQLADYLNNVIGLGKPGLKNNEVFIVGHLERFESKVTISGLEMSLLENNIESEALFCRRAVRIQDILETMTSIVVSDSISMRGVDKQIVIIIPNPRDQKVQQRIEEETKRRQEKESRNVENARLAASIPDDGVPFVKPKPEADNDEILLYLRPLRSGDRVDGIQDYRKHRRKKWDKSGSKAKAEEEEEMFTDDEELSEDDYEDNPPRERRETRRMEDLRFSEASHQSMLRRAINSMSRADKDMILDVFTDAPRHAILFHFAEDEYYSESDITPGSDFLGRK